MKRIAWYVPSTCAAILCAGGVVANVISGSRGWAAFDAGLVIVNLGLLWLLARSRRRMREDAVAYEKAERAAREEFERFIKGMEERP